MKNLKENTVGEVAAVEEVIQENQESQEETIEDVEENLEQMEETQEVDEEIVEDNTGKVVLNIAIEEEEFNLLYESLTEYIYNLTERKNRINSIVVNPKANVEIDHKIEMINKLRIVIKNKALILDDSKHISMDEGKVIILDTFGVIE